MTREIHINVPDHIENPAAYIAAAHRRIARNAQAGHAKRTAERRLMWHEEDGTRTDVMAWVAAEAEGGNTFAQSLQRSYMEYGRLSEKQEAAARKMDPAIKAQAQAERRAALPTVAEASQLQNMIALFSTAGERLKHPAVVFNLPEQRVLRMNRAGSRSNAPGAINVVDYETREYIGRIHLDGKWVPAREFRSETAIFGALAAFAADPAGVAADYGRRHGRCCFCLKALTDERSVKAGYGETCAHNFKLPWGDK